MNIFISNQINQWFPGFFFAFCFAVVVSIMISIFLHTESETERYVFLYQIYLFFFLLFMNESLTCWLTEETKAGRYSSLKGWNKTLGCFRATQMSLIPPPTKPSVHCREHNWPGWFSEAGCTKGSIIGRQHTSHPPPITRWPLNSQPGGLLLGGNSKKACNQSMCGVGADRQAENIITSLKMCCQCLQHHSRFCDCTSWLLHMGRGAGDSNWKWKIDNKKPDSWRRQRLRWQTAFRGRPVQENAAQTEKAASGQTDCFTPHCPDSMWGGDGGRGGGGGRTCAEMSALQQNRSHQAVSKKGKLWCFASNH